MAPQYSAIYVFGSLLNWLIHFSSYFGGGLLFSLCSTGEERSQDSIRLLFEKGEAGAEEMRRGSAEKEGEVE